MSDQPGAGWGPQGPGGWGQQPPPGQGAWGQQPPGQPPGQGGWGQQPPGQPPAQGGWGQPAPGQPPGQGAWGQQPPGQQPPPGQWAPQGPGWTGPPGPPPSSGGRTAAIIAGVVVLVLVAGGAAAFFLTSGDGDDIADPGDAPPSDAAPAVESGACSPVEAMPDLGGGHITQTAEDLAAAAPDEIYPDQPTASGPHVGQVVASGVYDTFIDERYTTHNMEHGYVVVWHDPELPAADLDALTSWADAALAGAYPKLVVAPYHGEIPGGDQIALTAWLSRMTCDGVDTAAFDDFLSASYDEAGVAPERGLPTHLAGDAGVVDPAEGDQLLPPLDDGSISSD